MSKAQDTELQQDTLNNCLSAVAAYRSTCEDLYRQMKSDIDTLVKDGFIGDASDGYTYFFNQVTPALTTNLTERSGSLTSMLENILKSVNQMLDPIDPKLKTVNTNAAGDAPAPVTAPAQTTVN